MYSRTFGLKISVSGGRSSGVEHQLPKLGVAGSNPVARFSVVVVLITACGRKKEETPQKAWKLYRSSRIRYLKKVADRVGVRFLILSAEYGLVDSEEVIAPYERVMDEKRCDALIHQMVEKLSRLGVSKVVFYRGGARKSYFLCLQRACGILNLPLVSLGYANMGGIREVEEVLKRAHDTVFRG